jgi:hypothetical protein
MLQQLFPFHPIAAQPSYALRKEFPMDYPLQPGARVRLTRAAVALYGGVWPNWIPQAQGGGTGGTLVFAGDRPHKPGAAPRPYYVQWDNGAENSYRLEDLETADAAEDVTKDEPPEAPPEPGPGPFRFRVVKG